MRIRGGAVWWLMDENYSNFDEDLYFCSKNRNHLFQPYVCHNASARLGMAHFKTEFIVMKNIHYFGEIPNYNPNFNDDLTPLTTYSVNKKKRWEVLENVGDRMMEGIQKFHENLVDGDLEILILQRVNLKSFEWRYLPFVISPKDFLIQTLQSYKNFGLESERFSFISLNSTFGQPYSHFLPENRAPEKSKKMEVKQPKTVIVYNFIRAPRNFEKLGEQFYVASNYGTGRNSYHSYNRRRLEWADFEKEITDEKLKFYENFDVENYNDNEQNDDLQENDGYESNEKMKYYDLYAQYCHSKDNDFVFVKRRRSLK